MKETITSVIVGITIGSIVTVTYWHAAKNIRNKRRG